MGEKDLASILDKLGPALPDFGITRIADITGLDRVGLPVALAVRPLGRLMAVNQGKGLTLTAAKIGAILEAAEQAAAESHRLPLLYGSAADHRPRHKVVDVSRMPHRRATPFTDDHPILWTLAHGVLSGEKALVPYELVHCDFSFPQPSGSGCFPLTTNGLGAGFDRESAIAHALLEVIERDAVSLFELRGAPGPLSCIDLATAQSPPVRKVLRLCEAAGLLVVAHDATSDLGVPTISCRVADREDETAAMAHAAEGSAARLDPEEALLAALTEALQSRLAFIAGTRDDLHAVDFEPHDRSGEVRYIEALVHASASGKAVAAVGEALASEGNAVHKLIHRLNWAGCDEPLVVDFPAPGPGIDVVRVIVPGLEPPLHPAHAPGPRALAMLEAAR